MLMIDGIKIYVPSQTAEIWERLDCLEFKTILNEKTALLSPTKKAKYKGLIFEITRGENNTYCTVRGSLHKYFNDGLHNADGYHFKNLEATILDLRGRFGIDPETAVLQGLEFGININTPTQVTEAIKGFISYRGKGFDNVRINRKKIGLLVLFQQYNIKIYDKGKQYHLSGDLLRFEFAINKMIWFKRFRIKTLNDLLNINKIKPLGGVLLNFWNELIYIDKKAFVYRKMSNFQQKKILYYLTPQNWAEFTPTQRMRAKKHFKNLADKFNTSKFVEFMQRKTGEIWGLLIESKGVIYNHEKPANNTINTQRTNHPSEDNNKRVCKNCKTDIREKKKGAVYCSKKCNNKINGMKRNKREKQKREKEYRELKKAINLIKLNAVEWLILSNGAETVMLDIDEIKIKKEDIKTIETITVIPRDKRRYKIKLTQGRARKLIREINKNAES